MCLIVKVTKLSCMHILFLLLWLLNVQLFAIVRLPEYYSCDCEECVNDKN
jgi:hypothetical protein